MTSALSTSAEKGPQPDWGEKLKLSSAPQLGWIRPTTGPKPVPPSLSFPSSPSLSLPSTVLSSLHPTRSGRRRGRHPPPQRTPPLATSMRPQTPPRRARSGSGWPWGRSPRLAAGGLPPGKRADGRPPGGGERANSWWRGVLVSLASVCSPAQDPIAFYLYIGIWLLFIYICRDPIALYLCI
jgi:hypothetical protein